MKIGVDISDLHAGKADGTTRFTYELAKRLPGLAPNVKWTYFSSGDPVKSPWVTTGFSAPRNVQLHISNWPRYWTQSRLWLDLYKEKPDVLFMPIQQLPYLRPGRMKTVAVVHDLAFHIYPEQFTYKDWALQQVFTSYVAREADHIISVSQATADDIARFYGRRENVTVIHHGVDHERFRPPSEPEKDDAWQTLLQWQPKLKKPYILYVGQIQPRKNLVRLIEAFSSYAKASADVAQRAPELVIAGSHGWLNKPIYDRVKASDAAAHILMPGRVPEELLPALYWHADVFVLPSLYEGFGMPLVEAMACGCPVVTSNVSVMPEVVGEAAVLVDPFNPHDIVRGITSAMKRRAELRAMGLTQAAVFSWDICARKIVEILTTV